MLLVHRRDAAHSLTCQLCARFGAGGLAGGKPRLDAGALVAAAAGGVRCAEKTAGQVEWRGGRSEGDEGVGDNVKPSTAKTGSLSSSMVKYLQKREEEGRG